MIQNCFGTMESRMETAKQVSELVTHLLEDTVQLNQDGTFYTSTLFEVFTQDFDFDYDEIGAMAEMVISPSDDDGWLECYFYGRHGTYHRSEKVLLRKDKEGVYKVTSLPDFMQLARRDSEFFHVTALLYFLQVPINVNTLKAHHTTENDR